MGLMDGLKDFGVGGLAGLSGNVGDALTLWGASEDLMSTNVGLTDEEKNKHGERSNNLAISSGAVGLLNNALGLVDTCTDKETSGVSKGFGVAEGLLGLLYGGTNIAGGAAGKASNKGLQKAMGITGGVINILGGTAGAVKSILDCYKFYKEDKKEKALKSVIVGCLGGAGKIFSGITGIGAAAKPNSRGWKIANVAAGGFGGLVGGANTAINLVSAFTKLREKPDAGAPHAMRERPDQTAGAYGAVSSGASGGLAVVPEYENGTGDTSPVLSALPVLPALPVLQALPALPVAHLCFL